MREVDVLGFQVEPVSNNPFVVLAEQDDPHRVLPLLIGPSEAGAIAMAVAETPPPRPLTHDLLTTVVEVLGATVVSAEIDELRDGLFRGSLVLRTADGDQRIDARPSDAIAIAVRAGAPILASEDVLATSGIVPTRTEEVAIDAEVDQFRAFLDAVDPSAFAGEDPAAGAASVAGLDVTDSDATDGDATDGDATDGDATDGDATDGDPTSAPSPADETADDQDPEPEV